ncbi:MAG TPA: alpha-L-arabinofuranosidase C-terminal domain-containing protein, partial [Verrucomicrobiae bacterium]|nr:alpha-L-arabinofuranosidase C-terminal domain-containing protein [Verrucomicrobiae bacterium]
GPIEDRKLLINRWNYEFLHRPTPDYFQSFGLGFYEYFQLCEDIGAEPLPILNCGMACQFNSGELCPMNQLDPFIQDALDLIEFANGPVTSEWGAKRAALGHPAPFHMKMLGVGNEQWGPQYLDRYLRFAKVLKEKHPEITLVTDSGPSPADDRFNYLWPKLCALKADIVDQHCYANPLWFFANTHRYDDYDRNGPKVFMGEYAAQSVAIVSTKNRNNLDCALAEAAYMTGMERNADVVRMASYAPLFGNADAWQWTPDLIWVNSLHAYPTPNYYVQQLFMHNRGDEVLPVELKGANIPAFPSGRIGLGTLRSAAEFKDVRVTRDGETLLAPGFSDGAEGWTYGASSWDVKEGVLQQADPHAASRSLAGRSSWSNYTLSLKARKTSGAEGIQILVRYNGPENYLAWNLGDFHNTAFSLTGRLAQQDEEFSKKPGSIKTGKWYDLKVRLAGDRADCYLDGKLVQSAKVPAVQVQRLYASATHDDKTGEVILKVVNPGAAAEAGINLAGGMKVVPQAKTILLTSANLTDENSFAEPGKVAPVESDFHIPGPDFTYTFPRHSMTVLRIEAR